ncbi:MAG: transporter permease [Sporolactobacillus laevolacticus]|jgi:ABC-type multidrug transport system fused ATPase/permease subunit|nr:transporter permease [Sporolactobacillus laevolacticus]
MRKWLGYDNLKKTFILLGPLLKKHWTAYAGLIAAMIGQLLLSLALASFLGRMTDAAIHSDLAKLIGLTVGGLGIVLGLVFIDYLNSYLQSAAIYGVKRDLKLILFRHTLLLRGDVLSLIRSGDLMSRFDNDLNQIENMLGSRLINLLRYPLVYCSVFIYLIHINVLLSLISWVIAPSAIAGSALFGVLMRRNSRQINHLAGENTQTVSEALHGFLVIRSFVLQRLFFNRYEKQNEDLFKLEMQNAKMRGFYYAGGEAASSLTFFGSLCIGTYFISSGQMTVGAMMTFITLVHYLVFPLTGAAGNWAAFQNAAGSIERIQAILDLPLETPELPSVGINVKIYPNVPQSIDFNHVSFRYTPEKSVLDQFSLSVPPGKKTAIVGYSGAGKTTLFSLLLGIHQPLAGTIRINGKSIGAMSVYDLRARIAYVPQEPTLFNGTIRDNLVLGCDRTNAEIERASKIAAIDDFVQALPNGYETQIGEHGLILSGGQKQRLAIARALLKNAPILLLDEATSALDSATEEKVKTALDKLMAGRTTLIIAHRLSTIRNADHIVVMERGRIVQEGTHNSLMNEGGLYRRLHKTRDKTGDQAIKVI